MVALPSPYLLVLVWGKEPEDPGVCKYSFKLMVLTEKQFFSSRGYLTLSGEIFDCPNWG
jgi:hypothetical protein